MKEQDTTKAIVEYLGLKGFYVLRLNSGRIVYKKGQYTCAVNLCPEGTPDIYCLINGRSVFFEVKKNEKEKETWLKKVARYKRTSYIAISANREVNQYKEMKKIESCGGDCYLVCSLTEVENIIKSL